MRGARPLRIDFGPLQVVKMHNDDAHNEFDKPTTVMEGDLVETLAAHTRDPDEAPPLDPLPIAGGDSQRTKVAIVKTRKAPPPIVARKVAAPALAQDGQFVAMHVDLSQIYSEDDSAAIPTRVRRVRRVPATSRAGATVAVTALLLLLLASLALVRQRRGDSAHTTATPHDPPAATLPAPVPTGMAQPQPVPETKSHAHHIAKRSARSLNAH
jgi:hypothetical protein